MDMIQSDSMQIGSQDTVSPTVVATADSLQPLSPGNIARQMQGCTPQQIDSAIQANLPARERFLSDRPDTLCIPGLPGRNPLESGGLSLGESILDARQPMQLYPELHFRSPWHEAVRAPYKLCGDDMVTGSLLLCFFVLVGFVGHTRGQLMQQTRDFFRASQGRNGTFDKVNAIPALPRLVAFLHLCLLAGLTVFAYARLSNDVFFDSASLWTLLGVYVGSFVVYFIVKRMLGGFVNWIFFSQTQRKLWTESNAYLVAIESILLFPVALAFVCLDLPPAKAIWLLLAALATAKFLLAFKALSIFFPKSYGLFHLFAYLCALELMPILALWKSLAFITDSLIIKY